MESGDDGKEIKEKARMIDYIYEKNECRQKRKKEGREKKMKVVEEQEMKEDEKGE